jgi:beta-1,4-N-acetylglucosaminyltransferase
LIFVTVGTTLAFDDLVRAVDLMVERGQLVEQVVCQIGRGKYEPRHCEHFRFAPDIGDRIETSAVVVSHGGTGSVSYLLSQQKPFVAVANPAGVDDHQAQFLSRLSERINILWTKDLGELPRLVKMAPEHVYVTKKADSLAANLSLYLRRRLGNDARRVPDTMSGKRSETR